MLENALDDAASVRVLRELFHLQKNSLLAKKEAFVKPRS
jgi:hypothetical protein